MNITKMCTSRFSVVLCLFFLTSRSWSQDTTFCNAQWEKVNSMGEATYYQIVTQDPMETNHNVCRTYYKSGQLKIESHSLRGKDGKLDGKYKAFFIDGKPYKEIDYTRGEYNGQVLTYWPNGKPKRIDQFSSGKYTTGKCLTAGGQDTSHFSFEIMPEYPGGEKAMNEFLVKTIKYPRKANRKGIQGQVILSFIVEKDGSVTNITVQKSVHELLDTESVRVLKLMPKWNPGYQDGEPVRVSFNLPLLYKLPQ
jgi:TonB family protein